ncbi:MAG: molybdopterin molybdotransferase MoeA [Candidatus Melainabacteria bacterium]|nr:molybdopterin molybdotransferase MoeA [Candidatus Melainabacteria bacterium]
MATLSKELIEITEAQKIISDNPLELDTETIKLSEALGRVLAEDLRAPEALPRYTNSAMDGFCIVWNGQTELDIIGESHAGHPYHNRVQAGQAVRISTGAALPEGTDTVVPIENLELQEGKIKIVVEPKKISEHVRFKGEEIQSGDLIIKSGVEINPSHLAMLASFGQTELLVYKKPKLAIILTGSELRAYDDQEIGDYEIRESNGIMLEGMVKLAKAELISMTRVEDRLDSTIAALESACQAADCIIFSGGVSVGTKDFVKAATAALDFEQLFWKIKQKPGKPLFFARKAKKLVFGLPGNPVSALFCFSHYIQPLLLKAQAYPSKQNKVKAKVKADIKNKGNRTNFIRVHYQKQNQELELIKHQGSHMMSSCTEANAFLELKPEQELLAGDEVELILMPWERL